MKPYFATALLEKLARIEKYALTIVEAPAGYGKTTAVLSALENSAYPVRWFTAAENVNDTCFRWFVNRISEVDKTCGRRLEDLGMLNRANAAIAAKIIQDIRPKQPSVLVFDNFQYISSDWPKQILHSLANRDPGDIRFVVISQNFYDSRELLLQIENNICYIKEEDFLLSKQSIKTYADENGIEISSKQVDSIYKKTFGWLAAVAAYLEYSLEGYFSSDLNESDLLCSLFWNRISDFHRELLLRICPFELLSDANLSHLLHQGLSKEEARALLIRTPMIRLHELSGNFFLHEILRKFLTKQL